MRPKAVMRYVKELFARVSKIHLLKIDVDDRPSLSDRLLEIEKA